jgi:hypothetical protein
LKQRNNELGLEIHYSETYRNFSVWHDKKKIRIRSNSKTENSKFWTRASESRRSKQPDRTSHGTQPRVVIEMIVHKRKEDFPYPPSS